MNQVKAVSTASHFLDALTPHRAAAVSPSADWQQSLQQALTPRQREVDRPARDQQTSAKETAVAEPSTDSQDSAVQSDDADTTLREEDTLATDDAVDESSSETNESLTSEDESQQDDAEGKEVAADAQNATVTLAASAVPITTDTASSDPAVTPQTSNAIGGQGKNAAAQGLVPSPQAVAAQGETDPAADGANQTTVQADAQGSKQTGDASAEILQAKAGEKQVAQAGSSPAAVAIVKPGLDAQGAKPGASQSTTSSVAQGDSVVTQPQQATNQEGDSAGQQNPQERQQASAVTLPAHAASKESADGEGDASSLPQVDVKTTAATRALPTPATVDNSTSASVATVPAVTAAEGTAGSSAAALAAQLGLPDAGQEETDPNVARIAQGLRGAINLKGGAVTIRLNPAELGSVRIEMQIKGNVVQASLQAQDASVRDLLTHQLGRLRETLVGRGLTVDRLEVTSPSPMDHSAAGRDTSDAQGDGRSRGQFFGQRGGSGEQGHQPRDQNAVRKAFDQLLVDMVG